MAAFITDEQKTFIAVPEEGWDPPPDTEMPTIFGEEENPLGEDFPGGVWETNYFPLAVPQLTIGSLFGTEAVFRWFEYKIDEDIGTVKLFGWGVRHSISQYIPLFPIDVAAGYFWQSFSVGDMVEARAMYYGLQASYNLSVLCFYAGYGFETSNLDISYTFEENDEEIPIAFELEGKNTSRLTIGIGFDLPIIKIHADYNIGQQNTATAGISFGF